MHMPGVTICYGMTETSPVSTQSDMEDPLDKRVGTVGRVHPHVEVKIVNPENGAVVPRGASGELCTRGYSVMLGYWNDEAATRAAIDPSGWMHTGDLATMDAEGCVNIVGRINDMIIRGGENVYPREVEEFLHGHPAVSEEGLRAFCTGKIATFKVPRYWKIVDEFPMTVTGKVQKFRMREVAILELGLVTTKTA